MRKTKRHTPENDFERKCQNIVKSAGLLYLKLEKNGHTGVPDRIILSKNGRFLLVEFKRPDGLGRVSECQDFYLDFFSKSGLDGSPAAVVVASEEDLIFHINRQML